MKLHTEEYLGEPRNAYRILAQKDMGKCPHTKSGNRWELGKYYEDGRRMEQAQDFI
jgi:hypothetical protein